MDVEVAFVHQGEPVSPHAYLRKLQGMVNSGRLRIGDISALIVSHDNDCPFLLKKGDCGCDAEIYQAGKRIA